MRGDLDDDVGVWYVDWSITNSREDDDVDFITIPKVGDDVQSFSFSYFTANVRDSETVCQLLQRENMITKDDDFVTAALMKLHQIMAGHELIRIVEVERLLEVCVTFGIGVFPIEPRSHFAPHFDALHSSQVPSVLEINPIGFVELGPDQEVEISDLIVFSN